MTTSALMISLLYYARLYDIPQPSQKVDKVLKQVGLAERGKDKVATYSKGMRQRLALARAMAPTGSAGPG